MPYTPEVDYTVRPFLILFADKFWCADKLFFLFVGELFVANRTLIFVVDTKPLPNSSFFVFFVRNAAFPRRQHSIFKTDFVPKLFIFTITPGA